MTGTPQKGWFGRNWLWFVPATLLLLAVLCAACGFGVFGGVMGIIKSTKPFQVAMERARSNERVVEALGQPIEEGFFVQGNVNIQNQGGDANLTIPISGPEGSAKIYVNAPRERGVWSYDYLEVEVEGQTERIDLREQ